MKGEFGEKISEIFQNLNLRLLRSQILPYDLRMWKSALSQALKKTAQIVIIEIYTVFGSVVVDGRQEKRVGKRTSVDSA